MMQSGFSSTIKCVIFVSLILGGTKSPCTLVTDVFSKPATSHALKCIELVADQGGLYRESHGFLLIYSVASRSSFDGIDAYHSQLLQHYSFKPHRHGLKEKPIFLLVGNKSDKTDQREVSREEGIAKAKKLGCEFFETSAKTAMNLERIFQVIVRQLRVKGQAGVFPTKTRKAKRQLHCVIV